MELKQLKVMIVEDESIVALDIKNALIDIGVDVVSIANDAKTSMEEFQTYQPDLMIMDINLNDEKDGIEIAKEIQAVQSTPVIFLTAFNDDATIQRAVEIEPVAYLNKPFKRKDLKSLIHLAWFKITKEKTTQNNNRLEAFGKGYFFDPVNKELFFETHPIKLTQKEKQFLDILFQSKGDIVPFERIEHAIWYEDVVSDSTLRTLVYRLRGKLQYQFIETIQGSGCRLNI